MLRKFMQRLGSATVIIITLLSVTISVFVTAVTSLFYGYEQIIFAVIVSTLIPLVLTPTMFHAFLRLPERLDRAEAELQEALDNVKTRFLSDRIEGLSVRELTYTEIT